MVGLALITWSPPPSSSSFRRSCSSSGLVRARSGVEEEGRVSEGFGRREASLYGAAYRAGGGIFGK
jgi:hypothetical protein